MSDKETQENKEPDFCSDYCEDCAEKQLSPIEKPIEECKCDCNPYCGCDCHKHSLSSLISEIEKMLIGIDKTETEDKNGWWETSTGAEFGAKKLDSVIAKIKDNIK